MEAARPWPRRQRTRARTLEQDLRGRRVPAAVRHELDRQVQVRLACGQALGEPERVPRLDQHVQSPALDFRAFACVWLCDLGHLAHGSRTFVLPTTNPARDSWPRNVWVRL